MSAADDMSRFMDDFSRSMRMADETNQQKRREYERKMADPCLKAIEIGDKVLVSATFLGAGIGFLWDIRECEVLAVADNAIKVCAGRDYDGARRDFWIERGLVVDVLTVEATGNRGEPC